MVAKGRKGKERERKGIELRKGREEKGRKES